MLTSMKNGYRSLRSRWAVKKKKQQHGAADPGEATSTALTPDADLSKEISVPDVDHVSDSDAVVPAGELDRKHPQEEDDIVDDDSLLEPPQRVNDAVSLHSSWLSEDGSHHRRRRTDAVPLVQTLLRLEVTGFDRENLHVEVDLTHAKICTAGHGRGRMFKRTFPVPADTATRVDLERLQATWTAAQGRHFIVVTGPLQHLHTATKERGNDDEDGSTTCSSDSSSVMTRRKRIPIEDAVAGAPQEQDHDAEEDDWGQSERSISLPAAIYVPQSPPSREDSSEVALAAAPLGVVF